MDRDCNQEPRAVEAFLEKSGAVFLNVFPLVKELWIQGLPRWVSNLDGSEHFPALEKVTLNGRGSKFFWRRANNLDGHDLPDFQVLHSVLRNTGLVGNQLMCTSTTGGQIQTLLHSSRSVERKWHPV